MTKRKVDFTWYGSDHAFSETKKVKLIFCIAFLFIYICISINATLT